MSDREIKALGLRLLRLRGDEELTALAARARVAEESLRQAELGIRALSMHDAARMAAAFRVPVSSLLDSSQEEPRRPAALQVRMRSAGEASLSEADLAFCDRALDVAEAFVGLGALLSYPNFSAKFSPRPAKRRHSWKQGYDAATTVWRYLGSNPAPLPSVSNLLENQFGILVSRRSFASKWISAVACRRGDARLVVVESSISRSGTMRWSLAHELAHHICDLESGVISDGDGDLSFDMAKSPEEQRADAFAAMFLAHKSAVADLLGPPRETDNVSDATKLAESCTKAFGINPPAAVWHLKNLGYYGEHVAEIVARGLPDVDQARFDERWLNDSVHRRVRDAVEQNAISAARGRELLALADAVLT